MELKTAIRASACARRRTASQQLAFEGGEALRHAEDAGHRGDREVGLVRAHEPEDPDGRTPVSFANQAVARERMSRSTFSCRF